MKTKNHNFQHLTGKKKSRKVARKKKAKVEKNHINKYPCGSYCDKECSPKPTETVYNEELEKALSEIKDKGTIILHVGEENGN